MKCPKCGNELKRSQKNPDFGLCYDCKLKFKWVDEITYENTCENCGTSYNGRYCPECGCPAIKEDFSYTNPQEKPQKAKWYTKTWFVIVMLILFWPVGLILMWKYKKNWKIVMKIIITAIFLLGFLVNIITKDETNTETTKQTNIAENPTADNTIDVEISDCHVKFVKAEMGTNMADEECLIVYYEFTNNSDEDASFDYTIDDKAFQDGIELKSSLFHVNDESKDGSIDIKPGKTITVASAFVPRDDSTVTLQVSRWISDKAIDEMTIDIK